MAFEKIYHIPLGLPVTEDRAQELARVIAQDMQDDEPMDALAELILGIAPLYVDPKDFPEADWQNFKMDLDCRQFAAKCALSVLFGCSEAFRDAFERYAEEHAPKQTLRTMEEVLGFNRTATRNLLSKHAPAKDKPAPKEKAAPTKAAKQASGQGRAKR